ncbi:MAG: hypothetical protein JNL32_15015 [Candidatus Kapabacteria bacterium]|nr:hypothetical protein [Candidatus Kapabacteria bacterium]
MKSWMIYVVAAMLTLGAATATFAQAGGKAEETIPTQQTIKPQLSTSDLDFIVRVLNSVNINGSEVDDFLVVRGIFSKVYDQAVKDKKGENDMHTVEMTIPAANVFLQLMSRASIPGAAAEKFQGIKKALFASAQPPTGKK